jgi:hypothetical protein
LHAVISLWLGVHAAPPQMENVYFENAAAEEASGTTALGEEYPAALPVVA